MGDSGALFLGRFSFFNPLFAIAGHHPIAQHFVRTFDGLVINDELLLAGFFRNPSQSNWKSLNFSEQRSRTGLDCAKANEISRSTAVSVNRIFKP